ncbi:hypothetical protein [Streptomyces lydicus]|uniref:hypothetical protein n=1 Tax=Streptomyces lydicus TaxID=47763 RepID=UPI00101029B0|nr:hypothetical protein [Streptomyces lydicus]MCZ1009185.1 hypothetical protein [Streptomyces lydicus]
MHDDRDEAPVRDVPLAEEDGRSLSSEIYAMMGLKNAKITKPGPHAALCEEGDPERYYMVRHAWAVHGVPFKDLEQAMERLKKEMPEKGWNIVKYGPDSSPAKTLELMADSTEKKFSVAVHLLDERKKSRESRIAVSLVSTCFEVPAGKTVTER